MSGKEYRELNSHDLIYIFIYKEFVFVQYAYLLKLVEGFNIKMFCAKKVGRHLLSVMQKYNLLEQLPFVIIPCKTLISQAKNNMCIEKLLKYIFYL